MNGPKSKHKTDPTEVTPSTKSPIADLIIALAEMFGWEEDSPHSVPKENRPQIQKKEVTDVLKEQEKNHLTIYKHEPTCSFGFESYDKDSNLIQMWILPTDNYFLHMTIDSDLSFRKNQG